MELADKTMDELQEIFATSPITMLPVNSEHFHFYLASMVDVSYFISAENVAVAFQRLHDHSQEQLRLAQKNDNKWSVKHWEEQIELTTLEAIFKSYYGQVTYDADGNVIELYPGGGGDVFAFDLLDVIADLIRDESYCLLLDDTEIWWQVICKDGKQHYYRSYIDSVILDVEKEDFERVRFDFDRLVFTRPNARHHKIVSSTLEKVVTNFYEMLGFDKPQIIIATSLQDAIAHYQTLVESEPIRDSVADFIRQLQQQVNALCEPLIAAEIFTRLEAVSQQLQQEIEPLRLANLMPDAASIFSQHGNIGDYGWCALYKRLWYMNLHNTLSFKRLVWLLLSGKVYDMIQLRDVCIVCPLPTVIRRDTNNRLHATDEPALAWDDGFGFWFQHGELQPTPS